jgi:hypothetical protein
MSQFKGGLLDAAAITNEIATASDRPFNTDAWLNLFSIVIHHHANVSMHQAALGNQAERCMQILAQRENYVEEQERQFLQKIQMEINQ